MEKTRPTIILFREEFCLEGISGLSPVGVELRFSPVVRVCLCACARARMCVYFVGQVVGG